MQTSLVSFVATFEGCDSFPHFKTVSSPTVDLNGTLWNLTLFPRPVNRKTDFFVVYFGERPLQVVVKLKLLNPPGIESYEGKQGSKQIQTLTKSKPKSKIVNDWVCVKSNNSQNLSQQFIIDANDWGKVALTIKVELQIYENTNFRMEQTLRSHSFHRDMIAYFSDPNTSDFTVVSESGERIPTHKMLLKTRSDVFKAMLSCENMKECRENELIMSDFSTPVVRAFLKYLYTDDCDPEILSEHAESLYMVAHQYQISSLIVTVEQYLEQTLSINNVVHRAVLAETYELVQLRSDCVTLIARHFQFLCTISPHFVYEAGDLSTEILEDIHEAIDRQSTVKPGWFSEMQYWSLTEEWLRVLLAVLVVLLLVLLIWVVLWYLF